MGSWVRFSLLLVWVISLCMLGIFIFSQGFLLKRLVIPRNSSCSCDFHYKTPGTKSKGCWMEESYKKAVIVIIDALRYDFMKPNTTKVDGLPYHNKFKFVAHLLKSKSKNARLMKFIADPPTTTLQRLKGLTTGGLPTFIDIGENFASSEINEDNIIDQLVRNNKKITFMGDETWFGLYPNRFHRSFPFPPFNVMDLHTVDNGVLRHLTEEYLHGDWDVLIAHFLGVDHCGHRYGPNHPEMAKKLTQMDDVIRNVTRLMDEDTVLVVMGDHGMTSQGDHGGDSPDELEAALLVYSPASITSNPKPDGVVSVSQIDLVPTLALLLGLPIPYSNVGRVITDLFSHSPARKTTDNPVQNVYYTVEALHLNAHQVMEYLHAYSLVSRDLDDVTRLSAIFSTIETRLQKLATKLHQSDSESGLESELTRLKLDLISLLDEAKEMCKAVWTRFNVFSMVLGISGVEVMLFVLVELVTRPDSTGSIVVMATLVMTGLTVVFVLQAIEVVKVVLGTGLALLGIIVCIRKARSANAEKLYMTFTKFELFAVVCFVVNCSCLFSNMLVHEDIILTFLTSSLVLAHVMHIRKWKPTAPAKKKKSWLRTVTLETGMIFMMALSVCALIRITDHFHACREEQYCDSSPYLKPLATLTNNYDRNIRFLLATVTTLAIPFAFNKISTNDGNSKGYSFISICQNYFPKIIAGCTILYWAQTATKQETLNELPVWQKRLLPLTAYFTILLSFVVSYLNSVNVHIQYRDTRSLSLESPTENPVHTVVSQIRQHHNEAKPPLVFGLRTVYSNSYMFLVLGAVQLCILVHSDGLAPVWMICVAVMGLVLELTSYFRDANVLSPPPLSALILWMLLADKFFYATGHQATFPNIYWPSAFVGFEEDHGSVLVPAMLVTLNTFSAQLVFTLALPLLVVWPYARGRLASCFSKRKTKTNALEWIPRRNEEEEVAGDERGEYMLHENGDKLLHITRHTLLVYFTLNAAKVMCTMLCAFILRRHLMVWKVFAPRLMFEVLAFAVTSLGLLLVTIVIARMERRLAKWTEKLVKESKTK